MSLEGSVILITGGTGSFGSRVARHLMQKNPREIRVFSRDEKKQWEMKKALPELRYLVGDVRDYERLNVAMRGVDYVFHAAALKQVPSCEEFPSEAVKTNVIGSENVCRAARRHGVRTMVALSTDKAVKPVNAMGISKAMMEKIVCSQNQFDSDTVFCCVRYGNVMGSRGSVIPLFKQQIAQGRALTLTIPHMTRFLMTLDESVDLVFRAMIHGQGGEVFVRKAPACTMQTLAETMRHLYSPQGKDHPIESIGIRPGEKIHEILVNEYEMLRATESDQYFTIHPEYRNPGNIVTRPVGEEFTSENAPQLDTIESVSELLESMGETEHYD
jgi:UDP-N-acetylglucosamine 4,6-dehydratase